MEHWMMPPGFASPYHRHHLEDEAFYVLEGQMAFVCDGKWLMASPGTYVFGPREIPHGFKVVGSTPARMLLMCAPGGFEQFVLELGVPFDDTSAPDMAKLMEVAAKYKIDILGPLPAGGDEAPVVDHKELNMRWIQAFNERDWKTEAAVRSPDFLAYVSGAKEPLNSEGWVAFMTPFTKAFPDARISVDECISEGNSVVCRWTMTGTHRGEFQGMPATGRPFSFAGIEFNRVVDGRIAEHRAQLDLVGLMGQIGG
jgi:steroid delta-isomerase-like uncharacterized protein